MIVIVSRAKSKTCIGMAFCWSNFWYGFGSGPMRGIYFSPNSNLVRNDGPMTGSDRLRPIYSKSFGPVRGQLNFQLDFLSFIVYD